MNNKYKRDTKISSEFYVAIFQKPNIQDFFDILWRKTNQVYISTILCFQNVNQ